MACHSYALEEEVSSAEGIAMQYMSDDDSLPFSQGIARSYMARSGFSSRPVTALAHDL